MLSQAGGDALYTTSIDVEDCHVECCEYAYIKAAKIHAHN